MRKILPDIKVGIGKSFAKWKILLQRIMGMENEKAQKPSSLLLIQNRVCVVIKKKKYSWENEIGKEEVETI